MGHPDMHRVTDGRSASRPGMSGHVVQMLPSTESFRNTCAAFQLLTRQVLLTRAQTRAEGRSQQLQMTQRISNSLTSHMVTAFGT